jgi:sortase B
MKNKIYIAVICALSIVFAVSTGFIVKHYYDSSKQAELYDNLIEAVETLPDESSEPMNFAEDKTFIPGYQELYLQNNDMVGWIKVEDTKINYPVMQSKEEPNFYLKHGFDKEYTDYGCPYVQENCDMELQSDNIIIYGHHMNDGSMFAGLMKYADKGFWEKHKTLSFDTLTERQIYEVVAAFKTTVYTDSSDSFKYYQFVNAETPEEFAAYVEKCQELSLYDTGVTAEYGDKLLTLSTCEYSRKNGRFVVVAKLINE